MFDCGMEMKKLFFEHYLVLFVHKKYAMKRFFAFTFFIFLLGSVFAQDSLAIEQARIKVETFFNASELPGLSVTIAKRGEILLSEGFGYADLENKVPVDPAHSKFRIGSVSKSFSAVALAVLYEHNMIDIDTAIQTYVPSFPLKKYEITVRGVGGHLGGIRHYKNSEFLSTKKYNSVLEELDIFKNDPLINEPGTAYVYSSYGWNLVSAAIESAAGEDFLSFMSRVVFDTLGMINTVPDKNEQIIEGRTRFYQKDLSGKLVNAPYVDNSCKWAGGGFLSTSEDIVKFAQSQMKPGYLDRRTMDVFFTSQKTSSGELTNYGIGWAVYPMEDGTKFYGHGGGSVGGSTAFVFDPEQEIVVVIISNMSGVNYGMLAFELLESFRE